MILIFMLYSMSENVASFIYLFVCLVGFIPVVTFLQVNAV